MYPTQSKSGWLRTNDPLSWQSFRSLLRTYIDASALMTCQKMNPLPWQGLRLHWAGRQIKFRTWIDCETLTQRIKREKPRGNYLFLNNIKECKNFVEIVNIINKYSSVDLIKQKPYLSSKVLRSVLKHHEHKEWWGTEAKEKENFKIFLSYEHCKLEDTHLGF